MNAQDRAALEIGRMFMRAHSAEQRLEAVAQEVLDLQAKLAEFTNGVEKPKRTRKVVT